MSTKINKTQAFKLFCQDKPFYMNPCKMYFKNAWHTECMIESLAYNEDYKKLYAIDQMSNEDYKKSFDRLINNWLYYNSNYEMGYYPHFYTV